MSAVRNVFTHSADLSELHRAGFIVDFGVTKAVASAKIGHDLEALETASFQRFWRLMFQTMKSMSLCYMRHCSGLPYMLAGMLAEAPEEVLKSLKSFERMCTAYEAALTRPEPAVKELLKKHHLQTVVMGFVALFAKSGKFKACYLISGAPFVSTCRLLIPITWQALGGEVGKRNVVQKANMINVQP
jgi:hypothetical protein